MLDYEEIIIVKNTLAYYARVLITQLKIYTSRHSSKLKEKERKEKSLNFELKCFFLEENL
jgi:hypothetical protein